jgi:hypothetical protein
MERLKQASLDPMLDRSSAEPKGSKLSPGDDRFLLCRHETDDPIHMND